MSLYPEGEEIRVLISAEGGGVTRADLVECFPIRASA